MREFINKKFVMIFLLAFLLPPLQVSAENGEGIQVDSSGWVTFSSQEAAEDGMTSLRFSFTVNPSDGVDVTDAWFDFRGSSAAIREFRYDKDTGKLNVYIAGVTAAQSGSGGAMGLGRIILKDGSGNDKGASAEVQVASGSLQYVCGSELKWLKELEDGKFSIVSAGANAPVPEIPTPSPSPTPGTPVVTPTPSPTVPTPTPTPTPTPLPVTPTPSPAAPTSAPGSENQPSGTDQPGSDTEPEQTAQPVQTPTQTARPAVQPTRGPQTGQTAQATKSPQPSETPKASPTVSPSAVPETSGSEEGGDGNIVIPATNEAAENQETQTEESGKPIDWVMIAAIIAIALFVIVAAMAVVVLKKGPKSADFDE